MIDAGDLRISDMGSMNNTFEGGGMNRPDGGAEGAMQIPGGEMQIPSDESFGGTFPEFSDAGGKPDKWGLAGESDRGAGESSLTLALVGVSAGVLAAGLAFALLFKRRRV